MATDWRMLPDRRPWSRDLLEGDTLTEAQAGRIDPTRLRDFGFELRPYAGAFRVAKARPVVTLADLA